MDTEKIKEFAWVSSGYTLLTLILTYPLILHLSTHFMGDSGNGFRDIWNMWWFKTALTEQFTNPYHTTYLHYPNGVGFLFQTLNPFYGLISIPLQFMFRLELVYNLVVLFSISLSGIGMYCLTRYLIGHKPAAFIAGLIYICCPYYFAYELGRLQLIAVEWIPFYVLYLFRTFRESGHRNAVLAGVFLTLTALCSWPYFIYLLFFTAIFVIYHFVVERERVLENGFLNRLGIVLIFFFVMCLLAVWTTVANPTYELTGEYEPGIYSADLTSFFVPSDISRWGRLWFKGIWSKWSGGTAENANFLGYIVFGLSIYALVRIPESRFWGIVGLFFWLITLGPYLRVMGAQTRFPLPYFLIDRYFPFFSFTGVPKFCMAILTAYAVFELITVYLPGPNEWLGFYSHPETERAKLIEASWQTWRLELAFVVIVGTLICLEYLAVPYAATQVDVPQFYRQMAKDPEEYGVIDVPSESPTLYYATIHKKPVVGGAVSRLSHEAAAFLEETPIVSTLMRGKPAPSSDQIDDALSTLAKHNIRYVITHSRQHQSLLEELLMLEKTYDQEGVKVYDCRRRTVKDDGAAMPADDETPGNQETEADEVPSPVGLEENKKLAAELIQSVLNTIGSEGDKLSQEDLNRAVRNRFLAAFSDSHQAKIKQLQNQFDNYDADQDGKLSSAEVSNAISGGSNHEADEDESMD